MTFIKILPLFLLIGCHSLTRQEIIQKRVDECKEMCKSVGSTPDSVIIGGNGQLKECHCQ